LNVASQPKIMQKQAVDHLTLENLVSTTSLESLVHGYILNYRCEGKSPKILNIYEIVLRNFVWYHRHTNDSIFIAYHALCLHL
jgi:hypothetical protein